MNDKDQNDSQEIGPAGEKLQKVLARIGVGSRRDVEAWITQKRIKVNGVEATLGQRVDLHDAIAVDGKLIKREEAAEATRRFPAAWRMPDVGPCCAAAMRHRITTSAWSTLPARCCAAMA